MIWSTLPPRCRARRCRTRLVIEALEDRINLTAFLSAVVANAAKAATATHAASTLATLAGSKPVTVLPPAAVGLLKPFTGAPAADGSAAHARLIAVLPSAADGQIATAVPVGAVGRAPVVVHDAIEQPQDINLFRFTASAGQVLRFDVTHNPGTSLDSLLRLFDAQGKQIAFNDDGPTPGKPLSRDASLTYQFTISGTYYVGVSGYPNYRYDPGAAGDSVPGSTGAYGLHMFAAPAVIDTNDQIREAVPLGTTTGLRRIDNYLISSPTDVDMFRFGVPAGQRVTVTVSPSAGSNLDAEFRLFDQRGHVLAQSAGAAETVLVHTFDAAGTFYVGVSGRGNNAYGAISGNGDIPGSTGAYTITLAPKHAGPDRDQAALGLPDLRGGTVAGLVYFDQNGDGFRQASDPGESSHIVIADLNHNGIRDDGEPATSTNSHGQFLLHDLSPRTQIIFAQPLTQFGWPIEKITAPELGFYAVNTSRKRLTNLAFGMARYEW